MSRERPVVDRAQREIALDPARSLIVQAPAGSGKTGLLIQRYLRLLSVVDRPEEILAMTFTRKAAAEMRRRVLEALEGARSDTPPEEEHKRTTWELARAALERDEARGWKLAENVARLRIQTIDSLCSGLARQMPVLSRLGAALETEEDARELYREAAERTLSLVEERGAAGERVARLLRHLDGNWGTVRDLLQQMLAKRDQWIRRVVGFESVERDRVNLEGAFRRERARHMQAACAAFPGELVPEMVLLARYAAEKLAETSPESPIAKLADLAGLPPADESGAAHWMGLVSLLLTAKDPQFRKAVNKNSGFPSSAAIEKPFKKQMEDLLERLAGAEALADALHALRAMPPAAFTEAQWEVLGAVVKLLPVAAAQLSVVFGERGRIDFGGVVQGAVTALGEEGEPTDLMLSLDVRLHHILVDEFQDTSLAQWELLTRLTGGWSPGDGRTVFLVGDPMQSIYRFREAEVALFLRAWREGLPGVALEDIRLSTNFRSQEGLVDWFNREFPQVLAASEDPDAGAVPYVQSTARHAAAPGIAGKWHPFVGPDADEARAREAAEVVRIVVDCLAADPRADVAILVRTRSHLDRIVPALKAAGVAFRAVDIEPLGARPVIQDLLAIARALSHPADRVAWLALLRAPWCALTLADLLALSGDTGSTVWEALHDPGRLAALSHDGRARAERLRARLGPIVDARLRTNLQAQVEGAWLALAGPACVERASDLEDAQTFFDQLATLEQAGELADPSRLVEHLEELFAAPDLSGECRVQLMTIHKAKGLEFDTVILPGLDREPRASGKPLFAWKARADGSLMMAPVRATGEESEPAYDYLGKLERQAEGHEAERLFYVAATRAKMRLHLLGFVGAAEKDDGLELKSPRPRSLLAKAWGAAAPEFEKVLAARAPGPAPTAQGGQERAHLRRLHEPAFAVAVPLPAALPAPGRIRSGSIEFSWAGETARHVGTIAHGWLRRIAADGLEAWNAGRIRSFAPAIERALARRGVPAGEREAALDKVLRVLGQAITEERGRWILGPHAEARSEFRLRVARPDGVRLAIVDRLFRDAEGTLWIVDFKTSTHEGADTEGFLESERERYADQLQGYAEALADRGPLRLGLYFPLLGGWREWSK